MNQQEFMKLIVIIVLDFLPFDHRLPHSCHSCHSKTGHETTPSFASFPGRLASSEKQIKWLFTTSKKKKARLVAFNVPRARGTCGTCGTSVKLTPPTVGSTRLIRKSVDFIQRRKGNTFLTSCSTVYHQTSFKVSSALSYTKSDKLQTRNVLNYCRQDLYISFLEYLAQENCCASSS